MRMRKTVVLILAAMLIFTAGCGKDGQSPGSSETKNGYISISQEEAKQIMDEDDSCIIVDVRRQDEYDSGHIPGAVLIPNESIESERPAELPDLDQVILVYCRSGNRSKQASQKLADMGYTKVYEFGGINTWTGEILIEEEEQNVGNMSGVSLVIEVNGRQLYASLENNSSAEALVEKLREGSIQVSMHDYGGFEKVGPLPWELPTNDAEITVGPGDVILYQGDQITVYYGENTWTFTKLASCTGMTAGEMREILGEGDAEVTLFLDWWDY